MGIEFKTPEEVAKIFKVNVQTVYRWIRQKKIKAILTPGGRLLITQKEINRFLQEK